MTAIAELPGPRGLPGLGSTHRLHAEPPARDDRAVGPALRPASSRSRWPVVPWSASPRPTRSTRSSGASGRLPPLGRARGRRDRDRDQRPVHVRGCGLAPPAPARGHRAQLQPPAPLLRGHPDRQRPPAHAPADANARPRSSTTSWPTASTSRPHWRSATTSTRSSTATASCSATSPACSRCWPGARSRRSRTGATSSRRPTAPPSGRWPSSKVRSRASSPRPRRGSRPARSSARRPRTSSRACWRRRPTARTTSSATSSRCCWRARTRPPTRSSWATWLLAGDHAAQLRLAAEADAVLGDERTPQRAEVADGMRFGEAVFREAARLKSTAPLLFFEPLADTTVAGVELPAGTSIVTLTRQAGRPEKVAPLRTGPLAGRGREPGPALVRRRASLLPGPQPRLPRGQGRTRDARAQFRMGAGPGRRRASTSASRCARRTCVCDCVRGKPTSVIRH